MPAGSPGGFHEQADDAGFGLLQRKIHVLVHADAQLLAGGHRQVEVDAFFTVDDARHAGAGMTDQRDIAAAQMVRPGYRNHTPRYPL